MLLAFWEAALNEPSFSFKGLEDTFKFVEQFKLLDDPDSSKEKFKSLITNELTNFNKVLSDNYDRNYNELKRLNGEELKQKGSELCALVDMKQKEAEQPGEVLLANISSDRPSVETIQNMILIVAGDDESSKSQFSSIAPEEKPSPD